MFDLTMSTAMFLVFCTSVIGLITIIVIRYNYPILRKSLNNFALFFLFAVIALIGLLTAQDTPRFIAIVLSNTILIIGWMFYHRGMYHIKDRDYNIIYDAIAVMLFFVGFIVFTYWFDNIIIRIILVNIMVAAVHLDVLRLLKNQFHFHNRKINMMIPTNIVMVVNALIRTVRALLYTDNVDSFLHFNYDSYNVFAMGILLLFLLFSISIMITNSQMDQLEETDAIFDFAQQIGKLGSWEYDPESDQMTVSDEVYQIFGLIDTKAEMLRETVYKHITKDALDELENAMQSLQQFNQPYDVTYEYKHPSGSIKYINSKAKFRQSVVSQKRRIVGVIQDITELRTRELELERYSFMDYQTNLYNRRYIDFEMKRIDVKRNLPITIIMGDLNQLKFVNDTYGHDFGDQLLLDFAHILRSTLREEDIAGRIGGDEFMVVLPKTTIKDAKMIFSRIRKAIENHNKNQEIHLSVALGFATKEEETELIKDVTLSAEQAMYRDKIDFGLRHLRNVEGFMKSLYLKDELARSHAKNVSHYVNLLCSAYGASQDMTMLATNAAYYHDIGKLVLQKEILLSTKALSDEEYSKIQQHPEFGYLILQTIPDTAKLADIILEHHERPDGKGYPKGLINDEISVIAKMIAICDAFDAMYSGGHYRDPLPLDEIINQFTLHKGKQFDAELTELFLDQVVNKIVG